MGECDGVMRSSGRHLGWVVGALTLWLAVGWFSTSSPGRPLRFLLITLEYRFGTFSGNGVYSTRQAAGLRDVGHSVLVVCGAPELEGGEVSGVNGPGHPPPDPTLEQIVRVPADQWGSLRADGPWESFASGITDSATVDAITRFDPDVILAVDWHGAAAAHRLLESLAKAELGDKAAPAAPPVVLLNYRVFSRDGGEGGDFLRWMETQSARQAAGAIALGYADEEELRVLGAQHTTTLLPALRGDIKTLALQRSGPQRARRTVVCCVRLAPEKNGLLFAKIVVELASFLTEMEIEPVLCAPPKTSNEAYRREVIRLFESAHVPKSTVLDHFLGPTELAALQSRSLLNFHPPTYDAFGMSVVEAAAFGTPSVLHAAKESPTVAIGAAELLKPTRGEALAVDLTASMESIAAWMTITLRDSAHLRSVGIAAQKRALEWDEVGNAKAVATFAADVLARKHS